MSKSRPLKIEEYVLGLAFDVYDVSKAVLLQKQRPEWQAGLLNGPGGKIRPGESRKEAMIRKFGEECGLFTEEEDWEPVATIIGKTWCVHVFQARVLSEHCHTHRDEVVDTFDWSSHVKRMVPLLDWLFPLALSDSVQRPITIHDNR